MRVVGKEEGNGNGGKSNDKGNKGGRQAIATRAMATVMEMHGPWQRQQGWQVTKRARARVTREILTMMRVAGNKKSKGGKALVMATRVASGWRRQ
jgi:hypothetical protein